MDRTEPSEPNVVIVDDDHDARCAVEMMIAAMGYRTRAFGSVRDFFDRFKSPHPACLVVDVRMPRQTGLDLYRRLLAEGRRTPVIFMTGEAHLRTAVEAMKMGAVEFLEKPVDAPALQSSIERALQLDARWREEEASFRRLDAKMAKLSPRERETLALIVAGHSNKAMANKLYITERAVELRRAGMVRKLGVKSTADLLNLAITHRILSEARTGTAPQTSNTSRSDDSV